METAKIENLGGNQVRELKMKSGVNRLCTDMPYEYFFLELESETYSVDFLASYTIYVFGLNCEGVEVAGFANLQIGDCVQCENSHNDISVKKGKATFLLAGTKSPATSIESRELTKKANVYCVTKPWGHELWVNGQHPNYALKQIYLHAGHKTSLQFHQFKSETNILFSGEANLHYVEEDIAKEPFEITSSNVLKQKISAISSVEVKPPTIHGIEAITDLLLYEVSTPHLDDVFRILDDTKRKNGRITSEHR